MKRLRNYFSPGEWLLWAVSVGLILLSFLIFDRENLLTLAASLIGVTSLIFNAKGNPIGQVLMILFSLLYGWISWSFAYYGEMTCTDFSAGFACAVPKAPESDSTKTADFAV